MHIDILLLLINNYQLGAGGAGYTFDEGMAVVGAKTGHAMRGGRLHG